MISTKKLITASVLSADFTKLGREIEDADKAGADWIHFDITDGHFVPNLTMGVNTVVAARKSTPLPLDVHLMIENPDNFITMFADAGADCISVHMEASRHLNRSVRKILDLGLKAGVAIGPATPVDSLKWIIEYLDYVLLLSVNPGFGGQAFIPNVLDKVREVSAMIEETEKEILIQADGGINPETIHHFAEAGVNNFVLGSAIFDSPDYGDTIAQLRRSIAH